MRGGAAAGQCAGQSGSDRHPLAYPAVGVGGVSEARVRVRLDGGFADPLLLDFLDTMGVEYVVAMAKNAVLNRWPSRRWTSRQLSQASGKTEHVYGEARYRAGSWSGERRVIFKAEVVRRRARRRRQPAFRHYQLEATPARDLRARLLSTRPNGEPH